MSKDRINHILASYVNLDYINIKTECINSNELKLFNGSNFYYYDFCDEHLKLVVEFHGVAFHPKPGQFDFKSVFKNEKTKRHMNYEFCFNRDTHKQQVALEAGYSYISVFSDDADKLSKVVEFIKTQRLEKL
jgi:hypothetical protein